MTPMAILRQSRDEAARRGEIGTALLINDTILGLKRMTALRRSTAVQTPGDREMATQQAREIFNQAAARTTDADAIANIELCREYFTNPAFRKALEDHLWEATQ